ncbi:hypothetical protein [Rubrolithibacter danxiaensis]|uniref:hypothetical protein n=1 Tax=Rubrolithibacter danxiaensis TaxID=3390805 RepID=UPI003BF7AD8E
MNQRQLNSLSMYKAVAASFYQFSSAWNTIEPIVQIFNNFQNNIRNIEASGLSQQQNSTIGYTEQRELQQTKLIELTFSLALKLTSYAKVTKNPVLEKRVNFSRSAFVRMKEEMLVYTCQDILGLGYQHQEQVVAYQVTQQILEELQSAINAYKPLTAQRDKVGDMRSVITKTLNTLFKEARNNLDLLDSLVEGLSASKAFIDTYKQARKINDRGGKVKTPTAEMLKRTLEITSDI